MKKLVIISISSISVLIYFSLTVFVLPPIFLSNDQLIPQAFFEVTLSDSEISLGESFRFSLVSENKGQYGDIHIVSAAFPDLEKLDGIVELVTYDFTQNPVFIVPGDEVRANYRGGVVSVLSQYPSIEAMSRPSHPNNLHNLELVITPEKTGTFSIFVKSIIIPHTSDLSHFPDFGFKDHQNEYVSVYSVNVN